MKSKPIVPLGKEKNQLFLRQLELEAYSSIVSALRAEGPLTQNKRRFLEETRKILNINIDIHKSEIRRAVNDEKLSDIFYNINGPLIKSDDWICEGRKLVPLVQKISPKTLLPVMSCNYIPADFSTSQNTNDHLVKDDNLNSIDDDDDDGGGKTDICANTDINQEQQNVTNILQTWSPCTGTSSIISKEITPYQKSSSSEVKKPIIKRLKLTNYYTLQTDNRSPKTVLLTTDKINKLNTEKFKILSKNAFISPANTVQHDNKTKLNPSNTKISKTIIPLSQFQLLNYNLKTKGTIKLLPVTESMLNKNNTIRINTTAGCELKPINAIQILSKVDDNKENNGSINNNVQMDNIRTLEETNDDAVKTETAIAEEVETNSEDYETKASKLEP